MPKEPEVSGFEERNSNIDAMKVLIKGKWVSIDQIPTNKKEEK